MREAEPGRCHIRQRSPSLPHKMAQNHQATARHGSYKQVYIAKGREGIAWLQGYTQGIQHRRRRHMSMSHHPLTTWISILEEMVGRKGVGCGAVHVGKGRDERQAQWEGKGVCGAGQVER